jgi:hypothetical protein
MHVTAAFRSNRRPENRLSRALCRRGLPNRVCVDDDADTVSIARAKQDGVADHRSARSASDNHWPRPPDRYLISATNKRPWLSTMSQE